tara:strand:+ start:3871 stop:4383 length:513 start_codon:yes stop_codon:yes gene_type:complete
MIRGKAIEESLRFYLSNKNNINLKQKDIIDYAFDYFYLRTFKLSKSIIKKHSLSIPHLIKSGISFFDNVTTKKSYLLDYSLNNGKIDIYPDFTITNIEYDGKKINRCLFELKIVNSDNFKTDHKYKKQALQYAYWSKLPVLLLYLVFEEKKSRNSIEFKSFPQVVCFFSK